MTRKTAIYIRELPPQAGHRMKCSNSSSPTRLPKMAPRGSPAQILVALLLRAKQLLEARGANEDAFARVRYELIVASIGFTSRLALLLKFCRTYLAIVLRTTCLKHEPTGAFPQLSIVSTNGGGDRRERWPRRRCASTNCDPHDLPHRSLTTGAGNPTPSSALNV
jgi:hypothetical protein